MLNYYHYFELFRFQEIVPLKASNVVGYENSKICSKWNSMIREALNKSTHDKDLKDEKIKNCCSKEGNDRNSDNPGQQKREAPQDFQCIISKQMVGIMISVWAKRHLRPFIQHPSVSCVGCGIMGCLGNKVT